MNSKLQFSRRQTLKLLSAAFLPGVRNTSLNAADQAASPATTSAKTMLFVDWFHVKKGELQVKLDPERLSEQGKTQIETYARDFNKKFDQSGHGYHSADVPSGIRIVQELAQRSKPWILPDQPWELNCTSPTVIFVNGKYRCWYSARLKGEALKTTVDNGQVMEVSGSALAYAESDDGLTWSKPIRKQLRFQGSDENNLVSPFGNGGAIFLDEQCDPSERYKTFQFDALPKEEAGTTGMSKYGLYGVTSPDGYVWTKNPKPLIRYFSDTVNIAGWDSVLKKYVGYFRHHLSGRTISRAETDDFWNWPEPLPLMYAGPLDRPTDDYYTNCFTTYPGEPSLRLMFPAIYHHDNDGVDVRLCVSRDGRSYQFVSYDPILKMGAAGEWDGGSLYAQPNLVQLPDGRLALPYDAYNTTHNEIYFENLYKDYDATAGIAWALWDDGRLAGIQADEYGQFTTISTPFTGKQILLNAKTMRAGSIEIELRERGKPVPGFSFADFVPMSGNHVWTVCRWKGQENVKVMKGKYMELAFRLRSSKVFAVRFV